MPLRHPPSSQGIGTRRFGRPPQNRPIASQSQPWVVPTGLVLSEGLNNTGVRV